MAKSKKSPTTAPNGLAMRSKATEKSVSKILTKIRARYMDAAKTDVLQVLRVYRGLSPNLDTFVYDNGDERKFATISGTIPVDYKSETYNIPICIWLKHDHPNSAPMAFVTPTADMQIKVSHHVDQTGRVYLSYLDEWKYPDASLCGLVQVCRSAFGELPPVFAKVKGQPTASRQSSVTESQAVNDVSSLSTNNESMDCFNESNLSRRHDDEEDESATEEECRITLVSSVENSLRTRLDEEFCKTQAEIDSLAHTNVELLDNQEDITKVESDLDEKIRVYEAQNTELRDCNDALLESITGLNQLSLAEESYGVQGRLHNQIMTVYSEDLAYDDAIYMMGEAFRTGRVPCDIYLRRVRNMARKQFFTRALLEKCREKAGIPDEVIGDDS